MGNHRHTEHGGFRVLPAAHERDVEYQQPSHGHPQQQSTPCVEGVAAGLRLLLTLPDLAGGIDDTALAEQIRQAGVLVHPLFWHRQLTGPPGLILGYAAHPPERLHEAVRRIAATVGAACHEPSPNTASASGRW
jgi:hypothetical protein